MYTKNFIFKNSKNVFNSLLIPPPPTATRVSRLLAKNKKHGWTLAETLITMTIIGIIAALSVPTLINNFQKNLTITKVKKAYANITVMAKTMQLSSSCGVVDCLDIGTGGANNTNEDIEIFNKLVSLAKIKNGKTYTNTNWFRVASNYPTTSAWSFKNILVAPDGFAYMFNKTTATLKTPENIQIPRAHILVGVGTDFKMGAAGINDEKTRTQYTAGKNFFYFVIYNNFQVSPALMNACGATFGLAQYLSYPEKLHCVNKDVDVYEYAKFRCLPKYQNTGGLPQGNSCAALMMLDNWQINW